MAYIIHFKNEISKIDELKREANNSLISKYDNIRLSDYIFKYTSLNKKDVFLFLILPLILILIYINQTSVISLISVKDVNKEVLNQGSTNTVINSNPQTSQVTDVRHKYSYVKLNEDGSKVAGMLELYGTNDYTQAVTINGYTQSGRGTFDVNGDKLTLSRTSGIAIDTVLDITKGSDNRMWLTLNNGITYVEDDNSSYLKSMSVTPSNSNFNSHVNTDNSTSQNSLPAEIVYQGIMTDNQSGVSQDYTLFIKSNFSSASIGGGPFNRIVDQRNGTYLWLEGTIIGMSFRPMSDKCVVYGSDGNYFCTLYKK
jgi:hypothetical protein